MNVYMKIYTSKYTRSTRDALRKHYAAHDVVITSKSSFYKKKNPSLGCVFSGFNCVTASFV
jgi:hypothetical protein